MNINEPIWGGFNGGYVLPDDEVHVWRTTLDMAASGFAKLRQILSPDERERADRFHFEADQRRSVIGRGYLRLLIGEILDLPASKLQFEYDEFGKPGLRPRQGPALQFNVSHSGDLILIAIARGRAVGVDVERIRTDLDVDNIAARFFSANECKILASLAGPFRYQAFFACWTRKEAYLKARGVGLSLPLDQFDVSFLPNEEPRLLATRHDPAEARQWTLQALDLSSDYAAALAAPASNWKLKCWSWNPLLLMDGVAAIKVTS
jgi:4'-phosphopantetheinyl transferase